jgi:hypothetical protein
VVVGQAGGVRGQSRVGVRAEHAGRERQVGGGRLAQHRQPVHHGGAAVADRAAPAERQPTRRRGDDRPPRPGQRGARRVHTGAQRHPVTPPQPAPYLRRRAAGRERLLPGERTTLPDDQRFQVDSHADHRVRIGDRPAGVIHRVDRDTPYVSYLTSLVTTHCPAGRRRGGHQPGRVQVSNL